MKKELRQETKTAAEAEGGLISLHEVSKLLCKADETTVKPSDDVIGGFLTRFEDCQSRHENSRGLLIKSDTEGRSDTHRIDHGILLLAWDSTRHERSRDCCDSEDVCTSAVDVRGGELDESLLPALGRLLLMDDGEVKRKRSERVDRAHTPRTGPALADGTVGHTRGLLPHGDHVPNATHHLQLPGGLHLHRRVEAHVEVPVAVPREHLPERVLEHAVLEALGVDEVAGRLLDELPQLHHTHLVQRPGEDVDDVAVLTRAGAERLVELEGGLGEGCGVLLEVEVSAHRLLERHADDLSGAVCAWAAEEAHDASGALEAEGLCEADGEGDGRTATPHRTHLRLRLPRVRQDTLYNRLQRQLRIGQGEDEAV